MAILPKYGHIAMSLYGYTNIYLIWVSMEQAIQMQQGIKWSGPSCNKLGQQWPEPVFSFVFWENIEIILIGKSWPPYFTLLYPANTLLALMRPCLFWSLAAAAAPALCIFCCITDPISTLI